MLFREAQYFFRLAVRLAGESPGGKEKAKEEEDFEQLKTEDDELLFVFDRLQNNFKELQAALIDCKKALIRRKTALIRCKTALI
jgi:predicted KAP-like P-loop ATPase